MSLVGSAKWRLTVPEPTITMDPASSRRGTDVTVEGTGFPADENVTVDYGPTEPAIASGRTGSTGGVRLRSGFPAPPE